MGTRKRNKRGGFNNFVMLPREWFCKSKSPEWTALSGSAKLFYTYLKSGFNGSNKDHITLNYSQLRGVKGLSSRSTISNAITELEKGGWINRTEKGGLCRKANAYELTGKYDRCLP
jgi:hypothetical protein